MGNTLVSNSFNRNRPAATEGLHGQEKKEMQHFFDKKTRKKHLMVKVWLNALGFLSRMLIFFSKLSNFFKFTFS